MIGLYRPTSRWQYFIARQNVHDLAEAELEKLLPRIGMLFKNGALLSSMTIEENIALPLREHTKSTRTGD